MSSSEVFIQVYDANNDTVSVPVQSALCVFLIKYLQHPIQINVSFVLINNNESKNHPAISINLKGLSYRIIDKVDLKQPVKDCHFPVFTNNDGVSCVAGLCAVLRQMIKSSGEEWKELLGFREGCLAACAEISLWTRFCEVDLILTVEYVLNRHKINYYADTDLIEIPKDIARFEEHMKQSVRVHNIKKILQSKNQEVLEHSFAESHQLSLADLIIFPCIYIILNVIGCNFLETCMSRVYKWYNLVLEHDHIFESASVFNLSFKNCCQNSNMKFISPVVPSQSLYKSDPKRYKPKSKIFTKQDDMENVLRIIDDVYIPLEFSLLPFGNDATLNWTSLPTNVKPDVPNSRLDRKIQQLENLAKAVLKIAQPGDKIVDFCSGSGHLGILIAHCLPLCHIILLDNKEESLTRARTKVVELGLDNIQIIQSNLDYFIGSFQVGMSLHACGVATDLVIQTCLHRNAAFIVCPCCYGSLQDNHKIDYPQSKWLQDSLISKRDLFVLGHCADQVHKNIYKKSEQGERCMSIVDFDRCLQAKEIGYQVSVAKLIPPTCTPRNNLLVGIPNDIVLKN